MSRRLKKLIEEKAWETLTDYGREDSAAINKLTENVLHDLYGNYKVVDKKSLKESVWKALVAEGFDDKDLFKTVLLNTAQTLVSERAFYEQEEDDDELPPDYLPGQPIGPPTPLAPVGPFPDLSEPEAPIVPIGPGPQEPVGPDIVNPAEEEEDQPIPDSPFTPSAPVGPIGPEGYPIGIPIGLPGEGGVTYTFENRNGRIVVVIRRGGVVVGEFQLGRPNRGANESRGDYFRRLYAYFMRVLIRVYRELGVLTPELRQRIIDWFNSGRNPLDFDPTIDPFDTPLDDEDPDLPPDLPDEPVRPEEEEEPTEPVFEPPPEVVDPAIPVPGIGGQEEDPFSNPFGQQPVDALPSYFDPRFFQGNPRLGNRPLRQRMGPRIPTPPRGGPFFGR
jgi:hypothetical protein